VLVKRATGGSVKKKTLLFSEMALIVASVLIFRSLWLLLDKISIMNETRILWLTLFLGGIITFLALSWIAKQGKE
jgi:hypothetical protein